MSSPRLSSRPLAIVPDDEAPIQYENSSLSSTPAYAYSKLPSNSHFRLLELSPGTFRDELKCQLNIYSLDGADVPPYSAVSYTWIASPFDRLVVAGKRIAMTDSLRTQYSVRHPLWCAGNKRSKSGRSQGTFSRLTSHKDKDKDKDKAPRLLISTSVRDMLRRFRHPTEVQVLWIDALCVNQEDLDERAAQIMTMQRIYHEAERVLFWLGEEGDESGPALRLMRQLQKITHDVEHGKLLPPNQGDLWNPQAIALLKLPPFPNSPDWKALMKFFERPVFGRMWIVQELVAARKIIAHCGGAVPIDCEVIFDSIRFLHGVDWIMPICSQLAGGTDNTQYLAAIPPIKIGWMMEPTLELRQKQLKRLLNSTRQFTASDPRDKIYALIGLINDYGHRDLHGVDQPDDAISSGGSKVKDGKVEHTFKIYAGGKSEDDVAIEILQSSKEVEIIELHQILIRLLNVSVAVASGIIHPSPAKHTDEFCADVTQTIEATSTNLSEFGMKFHHKSKDHERALGFAGRLIKMFLNQVVRLGEILMTITFEELRQIMAGPSAPVIVEETSRLHENLEFFLEAITKTPESAAQPSKTPSQPAKSVGLIGARTVLDNLDYSVRFKRQFDDWAWSAAGWTTPDYRKPVSEVYTEFTVKCVLETSSLSVLSGVEDRSSRCILDLPSWVPDFSVPFSRHQLLRSHQDETPLYVAAGSTAAEVEWSPSTPGSLCVEGFSIGTLTHLSPYPRNPRNLTSQEPSSWSALLSYLPCTYPTGESTQEVLWRTLIGDYVTRDQNDISPAPEEYGAYYGSLVSALEIKEKVGSEADMVKLLAAGEWTPEKVRKTVDEGGMFEGALVNVMLERRLAVMGGKKGGYLCAVPESSTEGDGVFVLKGGGVPFVLRGKKDGEGEGEGRFEMVGECYVHGVMRGEVIGWEGFGWEKVVLA
ncbi:MAG: hypothetical protein Q9167_006872 [Letrouitia subvulpina]